MLRSGRPRNAAIDDAIIDATLSRLASDGFAGMSLSDVASDAGTSRQALYRRWPDKTALVVDAIAKLARTDPPQPTGAHFDDLVAELTHFRHCISEPGALPLAGLMIGEGVEPAVRDTYEREIVSPRRARIRAILEAAIRSGDLPESADLLVAGSFLTGSWYALSLAHTPIPDDWPQRTATAVWAACRG